MLKLVPVAIPIQSINSMYMHVNSEQCGQNNQYSDKRNGFFLFLFKYISSKFEQWVNLNLKYYFMSLFKIHVNFKTRNLQNKLFKGSGLDLDFILGRLIVLAVTQAIVFFIRRD